MLSSCAFPYDMRSFLAALGQIFLSHAGSLYVSQDSCEEVERPGLLAVVKAPPKPRRAKLLNKGRKLSARKRGRPKKAAVAAAERKSKSSQSALDLLHAKTLSAAPPQGESPADSFTQGCAHIPLCICVIQPFIRCSVCLANFLCFYRCIQVTSKSLLPATSQSSALCVWPTSAGPQSSWPTTASR